MKFTIDRSKWRCGGGGLNVIYAKGEGETALLNKEGYMCCLGFCSIQLGAEEKEIFHRASPADTEIFPKLKRVLLEASDYHDATYRNSVLAENAIEINDSPYLRPEEREKRLKILFIQYDHEIEFVGEYASSQSETI